MSESDGGEASVSAGRGETLIEVSDLQVRYDGGWTGPTVRAVDGLDLRIERGETLGLVGESGCGKTTLCRALVGLERPASGAVRFDGTPVADRSGADRRRWRGDVAMVFQDADASLDDRLPVGELVREPLDAHDWKRPADRRERVRDLLDAVGLDRAWERRYPTRLSAGQRRRVGVARALALRPAFVALDEPVSGLDASVRAGVLNLLADLQDEFGLTYLLVAHDLSVVRHLADRTAVMYRGTILERGPTEALFADPAHPYTHVLLSAIPGPEPSSSSDRIPLRGSPATPTEQPSGCPFAGRCPAAIRPDAHALDDGTWERIDRLREIARERCRRAPSLRERAASILGIGTGADAADLRGAVLDGIDPPPAVREEIDAAIDHLAAGRPAQARRFLRAAFGSECDRERPADHAVGEERESHCHRHREEFDSPGDVLGRSGE
ncbi:peptide ABC transporter ATP-binding protein [Halobacteriales archaeon QS_1_68_17]|nr:MAG: peptide ABC transporter ATP-binding protein [Halobacteriales archaeon QS_1_68_17]